MAFKTGTEIKVGLFVFIAIAALAYMSLQVGSGSFFSRDAYTLKVRFDNVTGLKPAAPIEIAGIEVGQVKDILLDDGQALLLLEIAEGVKVRADATASIKSRGVLGDKFLQLSGGTQAFPYLAEGQTIQRSDRSADLEVLFEKVGQIADDIGLVAKSVANVMGGPEGERDLRLTFHSLRDLAVGLNEMVNRNTESLNLIVDNMRDFSGDLRSMTSNNRKGIDSIVENFEVASVQLRGSLERMNSVLTKLDGGEGTMSRLLNDGDMGEDLRLTVASLQSVASKIDEGKGTLGKLVNDENTGEELDKALEGINQYLDKQNSLRTTVDFHGEYLADTGDVKSYLDLDIAPNESHFYRLGIVSDPKGRLKETDTTTETWAGGGYAETRVVEKKREMDGIKFNAQLGKRWYDFALRGGLFESTGGLGVDYYLWDDRVQLFFEAFDFDDKDPAHLKAGAKFYFMKNFYAMAGMDDFAKGDDSTFFAGGGVRFTDDDIKYLMTSAPVPAGN